MNYGCGNARGVIMQGGLEVRLEVRRAGCAPWTWGAAGGGSLPKPIGRLAVRIAEAGRLPAVRRGGGDYSCAEAIQTALARAMTVAVVSIM